MQRPAVKLDKDIVILGQWGGGHNMKKILDRLARLVETEASVCLNALKIQTVYYEVSLFGDWTCNCTMTMLVLYCYCGSRLVRENRFVM